MTKRQVKRLLGKPTSKTTGKQLLSHYDTVINLSRPGRPPRFGRQSVVRRKYWLFADVPEQGGSTLITFDGGRVSGVSVKRTGE